MLDVDRDLLAQARAELGITVPVMRAEALGTGLKLWLYGRGGEPVTWAPKKAQAGLKPKRRTVRKKEVGK